MFVVYGVYSQIPRFLGDHLHGYTGAHFFAIPSFLSLFITSPFSFSTGDSVSSSIIYSHLSGRIPRLSSPFCWIKPFIFRRYRLFTMRFIAVAALAASVASAAPATLDISDLLELTTEQVSDFEVAVLGGMTLRAQQQRNDNFIAGGRGPRSYLKALGKYSAFGATINPELVCIVDSILQQLGLGALAGAIPEDCAALLGGTGQPGTGQPGTGNGGGNGGRPGAGTQPQAPPNGTRPSNATGAGQGRRALPIPIFFSHGALTPSSRRGRRQPTGE